MLTPLAADPHALVAIDAGNGVRRRSAPAMGTIVTIDVPPHAPGAGSLECDRAVARAFAWFAEVERCCSRFDPESELHRLSCTVGTPIETSALLRDVLRYALAIAHETGGAFDPTVGRQLERRGFNVEHRTRTRIDTPLDDSRASYRDVTIDDARGTVTLRTPLVLDLGAVAKGLAIDLAARELASLRHFVIDAGGDLYLGGARADGEPWNVGIRHPVSDDRLLMSVALSDRAVCTSGTYERRSATDPDARHIVDPRTRRDAGALSSVTVAAPSAMLADALATAAFVLGPVEGAALLDRHAVAGWLFTPDFQLAASQHERGPL